jgi:hypothetical protein
VELLGTVETVSDRDGQEAAVVAGYLWTDFPPATDVRLGLSIRRMRDRGRVALALTVGGWGLFAYIMLFADHFRIWMVTAPAFAGTLGAIWLWADYIDADLRPEN